MIDIVTVVFDQEILVLKAQAQSIDLYCQDIGIRNIYVVVNNTTPVANQIDPAWWGSLSGCVTILPRSVFSTSFADNGWLSQQALKLLAAAISYNTWSIILDAKTIFVKPLLLSQLFDAQERPCVGNLEIYPVFDRSKQIVNQLFNISIEKQLGPGGVPFVMHNQMVRALIADIEQRTTTSFPVWFQAQGMLTEFILYSGYIQQRCGIETLYNIDSCAVTPVNICHSEVSAFDRKFQSMSTALTVSIHRNAWSQLTQEQRWQYRDFLVERGITKAGIL